MKFLMMLVAVALSTLGLAVPAQATNGGDQPSSDNKKVTLCHFTSESASHQYNKIEVSINGWYNGHRDHKDSGDIWEAFSYTTKSGEVVNVPAAGDTSLLAFEDCEKPKEDTPVTKPDVTFADPCGTENDVFSVAGGQGYTVAPSQHIAGVQRITVTLAEGFVWSDGSHDAITFERPEFTNVDCDIPDTGAPQYATGMGAVALAGVVAIGGLMLLRRRQTI